VHRGESGALPAPSSVLVGEWCLLILGVAAGITTSVWEIGVRQVTIFVGGGSFRSERENHVGDAIPAL
jgi:hypothetical protein